MPERPRRSLRLVRLALGGVALAALVLAGAEFAARRFAWSPPTAALLERRCGGESTWVDNPFFGRRYFDPATAREMPPVTIGRKPPGTLRLVVLGESAALGFPMREFGFSRMLHAMLDRAYPDRRFEVVNVAMTAINSHALRDIADAVLRHEPDALLVYMGNNEVIGPYGAGTVFATAPAAAPLIRLHQALRATRLGQVLLAARRAQAGDTAGWRGLDALQGRPVPHASPRLARTRALFAQNLEAILAAARRRDVPVLLSTVAVNLRDWAPLGSERPHGWPADREAAWRQAFADGAARFASGDAAAAVAAYGRAEALYDRHAELAFRLARCHEALGNMELAARTYRRACDDDTYRFRCDGPMNETIRRLATARAGDRLAFVDADRDMAASSPAGVPGREYFVEHVHFTSAGNHRLAGLFAAALPEILPALRAGADRPLPDLQTCRALLGYTASDDMRMIEGAIRFLRNDPFHEQYGRDDELRRLQDELAEARARADAEPRDAPDARYAAAAAARPGDWELRLTHAERMMARGEPAHAEAALQEAAAVAPCSADVAYRLAATQEALGRLPEAESGFRRALALHPYRRAAREGLAALLAGQGRAAEALQVTRALLRDYPWDVSLRLNSARLAFDLGDRVAAWRAIERLLADHPDAAPVLNEAAWVLATTTDPRVRDPVRAVALAERAVAAGADPVYLDTLAAAYEAAGRPRDAAAACERALALAQAARMDQLADELRRRLDQLRAEGGAPP